MRHIVQKIFAIILIVLTVFWMGFTVVNADQDSLGGQQTSETIDNTATDQEGLGGQQSLQADGVVIDTNDIEDTVGLWETLKQGIQGFANSVDQLSESLEYIKVKGIFPVIVDVFGNFVQSIYDNIFKSAIAKSIFFTPTIDDAGGFGGIVLSKLKELTVFIGYFILSIVGAFTY